MDRENAFKLVTISYTNSSGKKVVTETDRTCYCSIESVSRAEFFSAFQSGMKADLKLTMYLYDYDGENLCKLYDGTSWVKYDIYRTYVKNNDEIELWCCKRTHEPTIVTLYTDSKMVKLHNVYLQGETGATEQTTGRSSTSEVTLVLPIDYKAFVGTTEVTYEKPKAYGRLTTKTNYFTIDNSCFFVMADIDDNTRTKYQDVNAYYDDCYKVQNVNFRTGKRDEEYIEVIGR